MTREHTQSPQARGWGAFLREELRPKGRWITPFNVISIAIMLVSAGLLVQRFSLGLGTVTNLSQRMPWGLWIGFDVVTGVAFAGGAYVLCFMVYVLNAHSYHAIIRVTVLNGFLAYCFYAGALLLDLGRPWNVVNPIIGNSFGVSSVLFLVAWHFLLYMLAQLIEFSPAVAEWLNLSKARKFLARLTLGAVVFGVTLSLLHQSGLGALFLMAKPKIHPLWYSEFIPLLFVVSSVPAGLSMVIVEGGISHRIFHDQITAESERSHHRILMGLGRICSLALFVYLFLSVITFAHGKDWAYLRSGWGAWYLLEMLGFVALPMFLFAAASRRESLRMLQAAAVLTMLGIILNRLNVSVIAFRWNDVPHYVPSWQEVVITLSVISAKLWVFRWIILRMPVLNSLPSWRRKPRRELIPAVKSAA